MGAAGAAAGARTTGAEVRLAEVEAAAAAAMGVGVTPGVPRITIGYAGRRRISHGMRGDPKSKTTAMLCECSWYSLTRV